MIRDRAKRERMAAKKRAKVANAPAPAQMLFSRGSSAMIASIPDGMMSGSSSRVNIAGEAAFGAHIPPLAQDAGGDDREQLARAATATQTMFSLAPSKAALGQAQTNLAALACMLCGTRVFFMYSCALSNLRGSHRSACGDVEEGSPEENRGPQKGVPLPHQQEALRVHGQGDP
jgi:hypothetical protein